MYKVIGLDLLIMLVIWLYLKMNFIAANWKEVILYTDVVGVTWDIRQPIRVVWINTKMLARISTELLFTLLINTIFLDQLFLFWSPLTFIILSPM